MKAIGIIGSPRKKGSTALLVSEALRGMKDSGAETRQYFLNEMNIRGCQGCKACKKQPESVCIQKDDMAVLYDEIKTADAVVIGSPVYMCQLTGQTKLFLDRLFAFMNLDFSHRLGGGRKTLMVYTQGQTATDLFKGAFDSNKFIFSLVGLKIKDTVIAGGLAEPDDLLNQKDIMEKAYNAGKALVAS
jgi:multimeric flavodoxin WrbA